MLKPTRKEAKGSGEIHYFTGKPCRRGHINWRFTASAKCYSCHLEDNPPKGFHGKSDQQKKEAARLRAKRWYLNNRQRTIDRSSEWKKSNPESISGYVKKYRSRPESKCISFMRSCIRRCMNNKQDRTHILLGYEKSELMNHLSSLMQEGMTWENYGAWHIDHIIPVWWFVKAGVNDPKVINKLSNLRPLWAKENLSRNRKYL